MLALVLYCINHTKREVSSFTNYKDMTGAKFKKGNVTRPDPFKGWFVTFG